ncbi:AAA family ATPase [uncultured Desulfobacter sp.]|uniref:AAA family ATPase n=1 Tax=uncultured Desulfobacter sp. TaxID=240139 RepID=UPI002AA7C8A3|nr:AAA family ATPase [uncultured Desulfobacter sp.]
MRGALEKLTVKGFKSIKDLNEFKLGDLNVIIGANGAGKSNFVQIFRMLMAMTQKNFSKFILERGGADNFLFEGPKVTSKIEMGFDFTSYSSNATGPNSYRFELTPTADENFLIAEERKYVTTEWRSYGSPSKESRLYDERNEKSWDGQWNGVGHFVFESISNWMVYHFHDTSSSSPMRRSEIVEDYYKLRGDAANVAPFLLDLKNEEHDYYKRIVDAVRMVTPFFDDFRLDVQKLGEAEKVRLSWHQKGSNFPMQPYHLSDGSIRFICLATALLQPNPPSTIIIDEPELGLHPAAIIVLGELIQVASKQTQVIVATQSPALIDQFGIEDTIVVNREDGASTFKRLKEKDFSAWLEDYSVGELWSKNVIAGGPVYE